jgi:hypothetical protein
MKNLKHYLAHVRRSEDGFFEIHHLEEHFRAVANLASEFALTFGRSDWGDSLGSGMTGESIPRLSKTILLAGVGKLLG